MFRRPVYSADTDENSVADAPLYREQFYREKYEFHPVEYEFCRPEVQGGLFMYNGLNPKRKSCS